MTRDSPVKLRIVRSSSMVNEQRDVAILIALPEPFYDPLISYIWLNQASSTRATQYVVLDLRVKGILNHFIFVMLHNRILRWPLATIKMLLRGLSSSAISCGVSGNAILR